MTLISSLRGPVVGLGLDHAVIECGGVGYQFWATPSTLATLRRGEEGRVMTYLAVKEDSLTLYGFADDDERSMFTTLLTISGMGPKLALASIGTLAPSDLAQAISAKDTKRLQTIPGVGKRMAERMAVELADKVSHFSSAEAAAVANVSVEASAVHQNVVEALTGLGFTEKQAGPVVDGVLKKTPDADVSTALRASLAQLGRK